MTPLPAAPAAGTPATPIDDARVIIAGILRLSQDYVGSDHAGIALNRAGGPTNLIATDEFAEEADWLQARHRQGPAMDTRWSSDQLVVPDVGGDCPWPAWGAALAERGVSGLLSTRIERIDGGFGALTLYFRSPPSLARRELDMARLLAQQSGVVLAQARAVTQLQIAVETRTQIGQAKGILMERFGLTADQAFTVLKRYSQDTNTKLRNVADRLVDTGSLDGPRPDTTATPTAGGRAAGRSHPPVPWGPTDPGVQTGQRREGS